MRVTDFKILPKNVRSKIEIANLADLRTRLALDWINREQLMMLDLKIF